MSRSAFLRVHELIKDDAVFLSCGKRPQRPVNYQLVVFLLKFGGLPGIKFAGVLSLAEGTVSLYSHCVCQALRNVHADHLHWPGKEWRTFLKGEMVKYGFQGCLGMVDGSLIRLAERPRKNPRSYFCRKKYYWVSIIEIIENSIKAGQVLTHRGLLSTPMFLGNSGPIRWGRGRVH